MKILEAWFIVTVVASFMVLLGAIIAGFYDQSDDNDFEEEIELHRKHLDRMNGRGGLN